MKSGILTRSGALWATLSFAIVPAGCGTTPTYGTGGGSGAYVQAKALTPAERRMRQESARLDAKSAAQGCLAGAAAGALIGMLSSNNRNRNMVIGAAVGCGIGIGVNAYVQSKRQQYHNEEQRMQAIIADVRADNQKLAGLISTSKDVIAADRRKIADIDKAYRKKKISVDEARNQLAGVKANRDHLRGTLGSLQKKESDWVQVSNFEKSAGSNTAELDAEIRRMRKQVATLEKEISLMDKQINVSPVAA